MKVQKQACLWYHRVKEEDLMKVLEIKNNLVKISNENRRKLILGGFVVIEDKNTPYVGQIVSLKADNGISYAIAKLIFTFNDEGIVKNYDGTIPALEADVSLLAAKDLLDILPTQTPVKLGNIAQQDFMLNVDISLLQNNLLICSDSAKNTSTIVMNFAKQLENNAESSVIFDIDGKFKNEKRFVFGENFKMPLNFESINFIYANDLNDVDATSKAVIQDIFLEVQEYTRQVPDKFIPFETFINVVEQQYAESNIPELALLKNKLLKYKEEKVFAESKYEISSLKEYIKDNYTVILDISRVAPALQREIILYVYSVLDEMGAPVTTFVKLNEDNSDKKLIKAILNETSVYTNLICSHNYKYVYELKEQADNLILFIPETTRHDFAAYNTFLNKLNHDEFVVWGKATQRIPLIIELSPLVIKKEEPIQITMDGPLETESKAEVKQEDTQVEPTNISEETTSTQETEQEETNNQTTPLPVVTTDFTQNDDTYTDLSDDVERIEPVEEDYSALKEEEPVSEIEEDDFDKELDASFDETITESQNEEALTNNFFTETKLQEAPEVEEIQETVTEQEAQDKTVLEIDDYPIIALEPISEEEVLTKAEETLTPNSEQIILPIITDKDEDESVVVEEFTPTNEVSEELPLEELSTEEELPQEIILPQTTVVEEFEPEVTNNSVETYEEDIYDEDYIDTSANFITSEPALQLDEDLLDEDTIGIDNELNENIEDEESKILLPDPTIDERIEEDLPEVEALFEELPEDVEITPYENTLVQEPAQLIPDEDELIQQVAREVDEAFIYNKIEEDNLLDEDSLTEDDLNYIDDINLNEDEEFGNAEEFEQIQNGSTQNQQDNLPIYPANTPTTKQVFEPGDHVAHPKYGEGIVEKMISAGDKTLCSINFANFGRRLLDPAISEITSL